MPLNHRFYINFEPCCFAERPTLRTAPFTSATTLGDVRGKIVLFRRFAGSHDVAFDLTYWPENQTFRSATCPIYHVHDQYQGLDDYVKYELVLAHLEEAKGGDSKDLYITFSSAVGLTAGGFAKQ